MAKILIIGASGQLGSEFIGLVKYYDSHEFIFTDVYELNILFKEEILTFFQREDIEVVINCAAYTAVDMAEGDLLAADLINNVGVHNLADVCYECNAMLIHISTDYVFGGDACMPYTEKSEVKPLGVYGKTKYDGEVAIFVSKCKSIIIRTSWLYSIYGDNFVKTMVRLGEERESLGVVSDWVGTPTHAKDLVQVIMTILPQILKEPRHGEVYHFSNEGVASWYDFAYAIMELSSISCNVRPIEGREYKTLAERPSYSVLNKEKIKRDFDIEIPYWRDSLKECLSLLKEQALIES